jgi:hypothetical protein
VYDSEVGKVTGVRDTYTRNGGWNVWWLVEGNNRKSPRRGRMMVFGANFDILRVVEKSR